MTINNFEKESVCIPLQIVRDLGKKSEEVNMRIRSDTR